MTESRADGNLPWQVITSDVVIDQIRRELRRQTGHNMDTDQRARRGALFTVPRWTPCISGVRSDPAWGTYLACAFNLGHTVLVDLIYTGSHSCVNRQMMPDSP